MKILIVEDEDGLRESLCEGLEGAFPDVQVRGSGSAEDAAATLASTLPDLVVSDLRLPGKNGLDFLIEVRAKYPNVAFILMSAHASAADEETASSHGVRFLSKPFALDDLISAVQAAVSEEEFSGSIKGISLVDLLQILNMGRRTARVDIRHDGRIGAIYLADGEIVHASLGDQKGSQAFYEIMRWPGGTFGCDPERSASEATIEQAFSHLLMEAMRLNDEAGIQSSAPQGNEVETHDSGESYQGKDNTMATINELCEKLVGDVTDAVAANVIDLSSGMMLGGHFQSNFTTDHFEAVSAAATSLYRGKDTLRVEELVKAQRGVTDDEHYMEEVQTKTKMHYHFMKKVEGKEAIVCLVTKTSSNLGMGWSALRGSIGDFEALIPS